MKNSLVCPKCESRKLWRIEGMEADARVAAHAHYHGRTGPIGPNVFYEEEKAAYGPARYLDGDDDQVVAAPIRVVVNRTHPGRDGALTTGYFDVFVCGLCGYSEMYAQGFDDLMHNPDAGVHLIDRSSEQAGPYR